MQLLYTPRSHFSRKVRIIAAAIGVELQLIDVGNVANLSGNQLERNPLMKVPTLIHDNQSVFDSDVISAYLVRLHDPADRLGVLRPSVDEQNARTVMNGVMAAEVELLLATRTGMNVFASSRFDKFRRTILAGLQWLERNEPSCFQTPCNHFHLVCLWQHLQQVSHLLPAHPFPALKMRVALTSTLPEVTATEYPA